MPKNKVSKVSRVAAMATGFATGGISGTLRGYVLSKLSEPEIAKKVTAFTTQATVGAAARQVASVGLEAAGGMLGTPKEERTFVPTTPSEKFVFGEEPIESLGQRVRGAVQDKTPLGAAGGLALLGGTLAADILPPGKGPKVVKEAVEEGARIVGNIRIDKFDIPESARDVLADTIKQGEGFIEQRRGVLTFAEIERMAEAVIPSLRLKKGSTLNAEEITAMGGQVATWTNKVNELASKIHLGDNSDATLALFQEARGRLTLLASSYAGATAEAGRTLGILRNIRKALDLGDTDLIKRGVELSGGRKSAEKIAGRLAEMGDDAIAKMQYLRSLSKPEAADYFNWYYYTNLLSGPVTHVRNIIGNTSNFVYEISAKPFMAAFDIAKVEVKKVAGKEAEREVFLSEMPHELVGAWVGMRQGLHKATFMFKNGFSLDDVASLEVKAPEPFKGVLPNIVSRSLEAADLFFRSMNAQRELYAGAFARVKKAGLSGREFDDEMMKLISDPPVALIKQVARAGARAVFREEPGKFLRPLIQLRRNIDTRILGKEVSLPNPIRFIIPFVQTPVNILRQGFEASPVGFAQALATSPSRITAREVSQTQGRALLGSLTLLPIAMMAAEGKVSGSGPTDPEIRAALYAEGWQPNSIKIGDTWYNYQNFQPVAFPISVVANAYEAYLYDGEEASTGQVLAKVGNSVLDQSFLRGLSGLQDAISDPERFARRWGEGQVVSLVPVKSFLGQLARAMDTTIRQPTNLRETLMSGIPFASEKVLPLRDALGNPIKRPGGFLNQLNPIRPSKEQLDTITSELKDNEIFLSRPNRAFAIGGVSRKMTPQEYDTFVETSGNVKEALLSVFIESPAWQSLSFEQKNELIGETVGQANATIREVMRVDIEMRVLGIELPQDDALYQRVYNLIKSQSYANSRQDEVKKNAVLLMLGQVQ